MIAFASNLPRLRVGECDRTDYDIGWLEEQIRNAASTAGHDRWWFAEDMARSVFVYLERRFEETVITLPQLSGKVKGVLEELGFVDIASELEMKPPPWRIDLPNLAMRAGSGYELLFFSYLEGEIRLGLDSGADAVTVTGLRPATRILCGARRWRKRCDRMHRELTQYVERRLRGRVRKLYVC